MELQEMEAEESEQSTEEMLRQKDEYLAHRVMVYLEDMEKRSYFFRNVANSYRDKSPPKELKDLLK